MDEKKILDPFSENSPVDVYYMDIETDETNQIPSAFQQHSHPYYEILFIRQGNPQYRIGIERFQLEPGDLVFIPPGTAHIPLVSNSNSTPYHRSVLWLSQKYVHSLASLFPEGGFQHYGLLRTRGSSWHFVEDRFQFGLREAQQKKPGYTAMLHANTLALMTHLYRAFLDTQSLHPPSETPQLLDQILDYIEEHLSAKITLSDTARHFYVSESTISALFRRAMGISFYRCVIQRRLIAAKKLIVDGISLEEVSRQVGFGDYSSFYRAFKGEYGMAPRQLRTKNK